jgi:hypothetical protein
VRVAHLFLADCLMRPGDPRAALAWTDWQAEAASTARAKIKRALPKLRSGSTASFKAWYEASALAHAAIRALFALLADGLTHMCLHIWMASPWVLVPDVVFPALLELTCSYRSRYQEYIDPYVPEIDHTQMLPVLRRLHLVADKWHGDSHIWPMVCFPPALAHFRISETLDPRYFLNSMSSKAATSPGWMPPGLQAILVAPHAPHTSPPSMPRCSKDRYIPYPLCRFSTLYLPAGQQEDRELFPWDYPAWRSAASHKVDLTDKVSLLRERGTWDEQRLFEDWVERMQGGPACWVDGISLLLGDA